jgi:hypothetical protein
MVRATGRRATADLAPRSVVARPGGEPGDFWFFGAASTDLVIDLIDACDVNGHYCVCYGATTTVDDELTVVDTVNGTTRTYSDPAAAAPFLDTTAFDTCE